jgi:hypothetical protein
MPVKSFLMNLTGSQECCPREFLPIFQKCLRQNIIRRRLFLLLWRVCCALPASKQIICLLSGAHIDTADNIARCVVNDMKGCADSVLRFFC